MSKVTQAFQLFIEQDPKKRKEIVKNMSNKDVRRLLLYSLTCISKYDVCLKDFFDEQTQ